MTEAFEFTQAGKDLDQYFTSAALAKKLVSWAELSRGQRVLEPSAGDGALVRAMPLNVRITAYDIDPEMTARLCLIEHPTLDVRQGDFTKVSLVQPYDVAIMNPPYGEGADGIHVNHALKLATRVIALVRANFEFGTGRFQNTLRWAQITRRAILVRRPPFRGPANAGHGPRHEYVALELVRRVDRLEDPSPDRVDTEFWTESWT